MEDILEMLVKVLVPISICVVLPILLVWISNKTKRNRDNKNAEIILKAIENNSTVDTQKLLESLQLTKRTPKQTLHLRLLRGCLFSFLGVAALVASAVFAQCNSHDGRDVMLLLAVPSVAIGSAYLVTYFVTRKSVEKGEQ